MVGGFSIANLLESLRPAECLQTCMDQVASMLEGPMNIERSFFELDDICRFHLTSLQFAIIIRMTT